MNRKNLYCALGKQTSHSNKLKRNIKVSGNFLKKIKFFFNNQYLKSSLSKNLNTFFLHFICDIFK